VPTVLGVGAAAKAHAADIAALLGAVHDAAGRPTIDAFATAERRRAHPALLAGIEEFWRARSLPGRWQLLDFPAEVLAKVPVRQPSAVVADRAGTGSVAEAAAIHGAVFLLTRTESTQSGHTLAASSTQPVAGRYSRVSLVVPKTAADYATAAVAQCGGA
jgi:cobalamin biosynthesis protein CbiG